MVRVTYPIHPFNGQPVALIRRTRRNGIDQVAVEGEGGLVRQVPIEWTDLKPAAPCPVVGGRQVVFDAVLLARAAAWVAEKLRGFDPSRQSTSTGQGAADTVVVGRGSGERGGRPRVPGADDQRRAAKGRSPMVGRRRPSRGKGRKSR